MVKIVKASDLKDSATLNMLIYGAPGVGKTTFAASAPKPLIINLEGGEKSIMDRDVDLAQASTVDDVKEALEAGVSNGYKTIVFDSLTRYSEILMEHIIHQERRDKPQIQDWGTLVSRIKKMVWHLQGRNIHTIFICHEKESQDQDRFILRPKLNGDLMQSVPGIVDVVGYLHINEMGERKISVNPTNKWYAKHRTPTSNKIIEDLEPDFNVIYDRINPKAAKGNNEQITSLN